MFFPFKKGSDDRKSDIKSLVANTLPILFSVKKLQQIPDNIKLEGKYTDTEKQDAPNNIKKAIAILSILHVPDEVIKYAANEKWLGCFGGAMIIDICKPGEFE